MSDEGFHEIQLGGKQLVFLFMAAAVVGVVLFLSGVMVGRGVRNEKAAMVAQGPAAPVVDLALAGAEPPPPAASGAPSARPPGDQAGAPVGAPAAAPPSPVADGILRSATPEAPGASEKPPAVPAPTPAKEAAPARARQPDAQPAAPTGAARSVEGASGVFAVQVAAPRDRTSAAAIAKRLLGKGYAAYVVEPTAGGTPPIYYRVRVGPFKSRSEADEVKRRLEKEEQFKPFITR